MLTTTDIRTAFLTYFTGQGHTAVPSSSLVPQNDPTLMFTNAGMVPFKDVFTGKDTRPYTRAVSAQKCVRAGGKHNDLDQVGYTARHHTFFEMLGNFSFGDYFKDQAIEFAWRFITQEMQIDKKRLYVTVYKEDSQAAALWKKIAGLGDDRIIPIATADNFWSMGPTGPCGPCTEIFYDHGDHIPGGLPGTPQEDGDRFVEIWNLVFMQFEQLASGERISLPTTAVDTGMSLERLAAVMQGVHSNYAIDLFQDIIQTAAQIATVDPQGAHKLSLQVIADHLRTACFLIADGVLPANEGRGYVLRRIMRRAMRHAQALVPKDLLMHRLVPALTSLMGGAYPELLRAAPLAEQTLKLEEQSFRKTLERGLKLLDDETQGLTEADKLSGHVAFKLYDTYGFPLDLTQDVLRRRQIQVNQAEFNAAMAAQKEKARAAWKGSGDKATEALWFDLRDAHGAPDFVGYGTLKAEALITSLVQDGQGVNTLNKGQEGWVLTNQTPFYGESGGQAGDQGWIFGETEGKARVLDTQKFLGDMIAHKIKVEAGALNTGGTVTLTVDQDRRDALRANHSATHLLHTALRQRFGAHVTQKGSLVEAARLRFDFSHPVGLTQEDILALEREVNAQIRANALVCTALMAPKEAMDQGALALFGEKYGNEVRVVRMGNANDAGQEAYSIELCGGTHVERTGDIGLFRILSESAISAGIRRIEAVTALAALTFTQQQSALLTQAALMVKASPDGLEARIKSLQETIRAQEKQIQKLQQRSLSSSDQAHQEKVGHVLLHTQHLKDVPPTALKGFVDDLKAKNKTAVIALATESADKVSIVVGVTDSLTPTINAAELVRQITPIIGGKGGGGRPDLAQGGGTVATKIPEAFLFLQKTLKERVGL